MNAVEIIFENKDVMVLNKPARMSVHKDGTRIEETLADWFVAHFPDGSGVGEPLMLTNGTSIDRPGIVHRLDKETSGVIILAKHQDAFLYLKQQFKNREVQKKYRAFLWGVMSDESGTIELPIGRSRSDFRKRSAERGAKAPLRDALTRWRKLSASDDFAYVEALPQTGRMHQIRVHFKALQHPLVGDRLYAPKREYALGFDRLALHAVSLTISISPGEKHTFEAPLPPDFVEAEKQLNSQR